jgi:hypothetical protein
MIFSLKSRKEDTQVQDMRAEFKRRYTLRNTMLRSFEANGQLTTRDLNRFGTGCSSRLNELRREGHKIVAQYEKPGEYTYTYIGKTDEE